jgi:Ca2+/Na+ antiporter
MIIQHLVLFFLGFLLLWQGAGLILSYTSNILKKLKVSPFVFSFVFLGILTSVPEFSIGIQAILENKPSVFVGNLLGGIVVLFLLVIPLLAVFGKEITIKNEIKNSCLCASVAENL